LNDARLWHPWLRINRVLRVTLPTRWNAETPTKGYRLCANCDSDRFVAPVERSPLG